MHLRIYTDFYIEDEFESEEDAIEGYLSFLRNDVNEENIIVEKYNEETELWE